MDSVDDNLEIAQLSVATNDRVTATTTIQNMALVLFDIEAILMGESTLEFGCEDYSDEEEGDDYDYDMEEELYLKRDKAKYKVAATKGGSKKKIKAEE